MINIERYDFLKKYGKTPNKMIKAGKGGYADYGDKKLRVVDLGYNTGSPSYVTFQDGKEYYKLDLMPHWERGKEGEITFTHDGACTLAKAVLKQTADDLTALYMGDYSSIEVEPLPNETKSESARRFEIYRKREQRKCEELLGSVISKYCKVRALWNKGYDIPTIAGEMGETPEHITILVERMGLNRAETGQEDTDDNSDEEIITEDF